MKPAIREILYVFVVLFFSWVAQRVLWFAPIIIIWPIVVVYTVDGSLLYLSVFALIAEAFSSQPPGVMALVILSPWLVAKVLKVVRVDLRFSYLGVISLIIALQLAIIFTPDLFDHATLSVIPWMKVLPTFVFATLLTFAVTVLVRFNRSW